MSLRRDLFAALESYFYYTIARYEYYKKSLHAVMIGVIMSTGAGFCGLGWRLNRNRQLLDFYQ